MDMGIYLLSRASRTATGDTGVGVKTADEVRAIAVRSISGIKSLELWLRLWFERRNDVPPPLKAFFLKLRAISTSSSVCLRGEMAEGGEINEYY